MSHNLEYDLYYLRKGDIPAVARQLGVHINLVRYVLKGKPAHSDKCDAIRRALTEVTRVNLAKLAASQPKLNIPKTLIES